MSGVYVIARSLWKHPLFKDEPFTEREAWSWMIGEAAWENKRVRMGRTVVELKRGQLAHTRRFLAIKWQWDESKVRRFLDRLTKEQMIVRQTTNETTTTTICNYNQFQFGRPADDQQNGQQTASQRPKEKEDKNLRKTDLGVGAAPLLSDSAFEIATAIGKLCGYADPMDWPPGWAGAPMRVQTWLNSGWGREMIIAASTEAIAKKRDGPPSSINYFEKPIANFIAKQAAPLPQVKIQQQETISVIRQDERTRSKDDFRAALRELGEYARGGGPGATVVQLLPTPGRGGRADAAVGGDSDDAAIPNRSGEGGLQSG